MTDKISFIVRLPTRPEKRDQMRAALYQVLDAMAAEPDFINTWVHEDASEPDILVLYETWACSRDAFMQNHLAKPYRQAYEAALPEMLSRPRSIDFLNPLRTITSPN